MKEKNDPRRIVVKIAKLLDELHIPYIVTGGIAVLIWGRPRFTADVDLVIELQGNQINALKEALDGLGKMGYVDKDMMKEALERGGEFNYIDAASGMKIDFWVFQKGEPFDVSRMQRRVPKKMLDYDVYFTAPEDLILIKLKWFKESQSDRQKADIESIFKISGDRLDRAYLYQWAEKLDVAAELEAIEEAM